MLSHLNGKHTQASSVNLCMCVCLSCWLSMCQLIADCWLAAGREKGSNSVLLYIACSTTISLAYTYSRQEKPHDGAWRRHTLPFPCEATHLHSTSSSTMPEITPSTTFSCGERSLIHLITVSIGSLTLASLSSACAWLAGCPPYAGWLPAPYGWLGL